MADVSTRAVRRSVRTRQIPVLFVVAVLTASLQPITDASAQTVSTESVAVASRNDDAEERVNGSVSRGSSDLELVFDQGGNQTVGIRFASVSLPPGARIVDARVQFTVDETNSGPAVLTIRGEAEDVAAAYTSASYGISTRSTTAESVVWTPPDWLVVGEAGAAQETPSLAGIVQEIIDRPGWVDGNPVALIISGTGERTAESFNGSAASAPVLTIDYEVTGTFIESFASDAADVPLGNGVTFSWVVSDSGGGPVACALDVDDDGTPEYNFADCTGTTSQAHTYPSPGSFTARLTATGVSGTAEATTAVQVVDPSALAFERRIAASSNDAEESADGRVGRTSSDLELVFDGTDQTVGLLFDGVDVPASATITRAYVQFTADETNTGTTNLTIRGEASDAAAAYTSTSFGISSRPTTTSQVAWSPPAWSTVGEAGPGQRTPDLSAVIQEVMSRSGWLRGNPVALVITGSGERTAESFNGDSSAAPLLHLEYRASGATVVSFGGTPADPMTGESVLFTWEVAGSGAGTVSCTLDVDDDGTPEYSFPDCEATTQQGHVYASPGSMTARLTATDASGSVSATTPIIVSDPSAQIVERRVVDGFDDAEERVDGSISRSSSDLELVFDRGGDQTVGMRFTSLDVPPAATITRAWVQFTVDEANVDPTSLSFAAEATDDAAPFASTAFDISSRPSTSQTVAWSPPPWDVIGEAGEAQRTPDISPIIQEVVDRLGWERGRSMAILVTGSGERTAESFNGSPGSAPLLHVEYRQDVVINSFESSPTNPPPGDTVTFTWSVSHMNGLPVSCALDVDDDGTVDYTIVDCVGTTSQTHVYGSEGFNTARLLATDGTGKARASSLVNVVDPQTVIVAAAGDIACDPTSSSFNGGSGTSSNCAMLATSDAVLGMSPHAVLALGDNQYEDGSLSQYQQSYDLNWGRFKNITRPAVGNHEYKTLDATGHYDYFGAAAGDPTKGYYSYDVGNWHIIVLNSNCSKVGGCSAGSPQEQWLRADLAANPAACTLAYWHHPLFSSGAIGSITWSHDWWVALDEAGADIVLTGHDHHYERFGPQDADGNGLTEGIRSFVVGTGGRNHTSVGTPIANSEVAHSGTYGVLKLTLRPTSYEWDFVPVAGETWTDSGSDSCR